MSRIFISHAVPDNASALALMRSDACIINAARGGLIDHQALVTALSEGRLMGAGLDVFEREPLENLSRKGLVHAFRHRGFWHAMDTLRDKQRLEELWAGGRAPWKTW